MGRKQPTYRKQQARRHVALAASHGGKSCGGRVKRQDGESVCAQFERHQHAKPFAATIDLPSALMAMASRTDRSRSTSAPEITRSWLLAAIRNCAACRRGAVSEQESSESSGCQGRSFATTSIGAHNRAPAAGVLLLSCGSCRWRRQRCVCEAWASVVCVNIVVRSRDALEKRFNHNQVSPARVRVQLCV